MDLTCYSGGVRLLIELNRKKNGDVNPRMWMIAEKDGKFGHPALLATGGQRDNRAGDGAFEHR